MRKQNNVRKKHKYCAFQLVSDNPFLAGKLGQLFSAAMPNMVAINWPLFEATDLDLTRRKEITK